MATDVQTPEQELESLTGASAPNQAAPPSTAPDHEKEFESLTGAQAKPSPKSWIDWLGEHVPHYKLTPQQRVDLGPKPGTDLEHLGEMVPQSAVPALAAAKKYAVDPFNKLTEKGAKATSELAEGFAATEPGSPNSLTPPPNVEGTQQLIEKYRTEHPIESGVVRGAGSVVGGMVSDPRNWPFFGASAARPLLQRLLTAGFASQMSVGATKEVKELIKDWPELTPTERSERMTTGVISTAMAALATTHAITSEMGTIAENNMHKSPEDMLTAIKKKQAAGKGSGLTPDELRIQDLDAQRSGLQPPPAVASGETLTPPPSVPVAAPEPAQPTVKTLPGKPPSQEVLSEAGLPGTVPENVREVSPKEITADPQRFQFRAGLSESGLGDINTYDPTLGGILSVWKDPADGDTYVVNGHHRLDLANRAGADNVLVRYLDATDAKDARAQGALINIADGNASAIDAAKFFRDTGMTAQDLANRNVSLGKKAARDGVALANLSDGIFDRVIQGDIPQGRAVVIGQELPNMADQSAILQMIDSQGKKGVRLTDSEVRDMATFVKSKAKTTDTVATLFGDQFIEQSNAVPWVQLSSWIRKTLARDKQLFGFVAKSERARELARAGNIIDVEKSGQVADQAKIASEVYDKLLNRAGPVSKALDEGAARIARGDEVQEVRAETYAKINGAVSEALGGTEGQVRGPSETSPTGAEPAASGGAAATEVIPMGEMRLRDALKSHPTIGPAADDLIDSMGVVTQNALGKSLDEFLRENWADVRFEGKPGEGALGQQATYATTLAWAKRAGAVSIEPHGEQLDLFGNPEKVYMLTNKDGQQAMVLESELEKMSDEIPSLGRKWAFVKETGNAAELAPEGEATLPPEQGGLFGNIKRGVEDEPGSLFAAPPDDSILFQEQNPVWYNKSSNILADPKLANAQSGPQWFAFLKNQGVKADEFKWLGLDDYLRDKKKVTKQELQDFIRENQVGVTEIVKNRPQYPEKPTWDQVGGGLVENSGATKYGQYTLPGDRSNYTELLLTLPDQGDSRQLKFELEQAEVERNEYLRTGRPTPGDVELRFQDAQTALRKAGNNATQFKSGHFDEPNILAHVRFDDRVDADGKRMLFLEEVQSDWHQKGKKLGYKEKGDITKATSGELETARNRVTELLKKDDMGGWDSVSQAYGDAVQVANGEVGNEYSPETLRAVREYEALRGRSVGVPDAPFRNDWHEMAMKRMIRYAAEHGYEKLGWVTGDQTAERYDLSKQIDTVSYSGSNLKAFDADGKEVISRTGVRPEDLPGIIGKEPAQRLLEKEPQGTLRTIEGQELKVGGEWANNLYDKAIPNFLSKYGKKWGAKVGDAEIVATDFMRDRHYEGPERSRTDLSVAAGKGKTVSVSSAAREVQDAMYRGMPFADAMYRHGTDALAEELGGKFVIDRKPTSVHSMDVTPEMKRSVMEGQPLFQEKKGATEFLNDGKAIVYLFKNADASTFMHEFVHTLEPYLKAEDRGILDKWLDDAGFDGTRERKEALARAFEDFHYSNEAPTPEIKGVFQRIQEIMRQIYESIKDSPLVKPSAEVNDLFKRWYGGETEKVVPEYELEQVVGTPNLFDTSQRKPLLDVNPMSMELRDSLPPPPGLEVPGPGAKNVNTVKETPSDILQLRDSLAAVVSPNTPFSERFKMGDRLATTLSSGADAITSAWNKVKTNMVAAWDAYRRPGQWTDFKDMVGKWSFADQKAENDAYQFAQEIVRQVPQKVRREAMINYIEAGGDTEVLLDRYLRTEGQYKDGYRVATELNESEKTLAENIKNYFESRLQAAIDAGLLKEGVENYVNRILRKADDSPQVQKLMGDIAVGKLQTNPRFAMKRVFDTSFEAEQAGREHVNKDIGFSVTAYDLAFNRALSARAFIKSMLEGNATDGKPLVAITGSGRQLEPKELESGEMSAAPFVIRPRSLPEETANYRIVDHPALRKWNWVAKDAEGNPIYLQGNLAVHPEIYDHVKNALSKSWFRDNPISGFALKGMDTLKGTLLSASFFHQQQIGTHAIGHWVNPVNVPEINWDSAVDRGLIEHGAQVVNHHALEEFSDGVGGTGLLKYVPVVGPKLVEYQEYLFGDYIPRLKMEMGRAAFDRNTERYGDKLTRDQIFEMTANQMNAAFGELNYRMLGRNPTFQDGLRFLLLAPDFLESRTRFTGQALKPYGREQAIALIRIGAILWGGSRILNMALNNGDPKYDKPFSVVAGAHEFSMRSIPGDLYHLATNPKSFALWRLNPFTVRPAMELLYGRDAFGRTQTVGQQAREFMKGIEPIPVHETLDAGINWLKKEIPSLPLDWFGAKPNAEIWRGLLESIGIREATYRSPAAEFTRKTAMDQLPANLTNEQFAHSAKMHELGQAYHAGSIDQGRLDQLVKDGKVSQADVKTIQSKRGGYDEFQRDFSRVDARKGMEAWGMMSSEEKAKFENAMIEKLNNSRKLSNAERDKFMKQVLSDGHSKDSLRPPPGHGNSLQPPPSVSP